MAIDILWVALVLGGIFIVVALDIMGFSLVRKNHFPLEGRTVVLTGASQGMGKELARQLAEKGANVVLVARDQKKLADTKAYITSHAKSPQTQRFHTISADVTSLAENERLIQETIVWNNGQPPDIVWANAGVCIPKLFMSYDIQTLRDQMDLNYWASVYLSRAVFAHWLAPTASPQSVNLKVPARQFVMTSSTLAFAPIAGYAAYTIPKAGLRALADTFRYELSMYNASRRPSKGSSVTQCPTHDVQVHCVFAGGISSPGHAQEELIKHQVTKDLEALDPIQTPEEVASIAIAGLERGAHLFATNWLGHLMKWSSQNGGPRDGSSFGLGWVADLVMGWVTGILWLFINPDLESTAWKYGRRYGVVDVRKEDGDKGAGKDAEARRKDKVKQGV